MRRASHVRWTTATAKKYSSTPARNRTTNFWTLVVPQLRSQKNFSYHRLACQLSLLRYGSYYETYVLPFYSSVAVLLIHSYGNNIQTYSIASSPKSWSLVTASRRLKSTALLCKKKMTELSRRQEAMDIQTKIAHRCLDCRKFPPIQECLGQDPKLKCERILSFEVEEADLTWIEVIKITYCNTLYFRLSCKTLYLK